MPRSPFSRADDTRIEAEMSKTRSVAVWFLVSEADEPLGLLFREAGGAVPEKGARIQDGEKWKVAEIVEFSELYGTCASRRFRVVVRVLD